MTDEKFEEFLKKAARGYNAPPARAPREVMWSAIQAARAAGPRVAHGGAPNLRSTGERRLVSKLWLAVAAGLVLVASGIGIGRWTASLTRPAANTVSAPQGNPARTATMNEPPPVDGPVAPSVLAAEGSSRAGAMPDRMPSEDRTAWPGRAGISSGNSRPNNQQPSAYQLAAANHWSQAEALLTSFRTRPSSDQQVDAQLATWARELLSNTRLLLDSPVAADAQRRPLLLDLELLLVQIVQLSPGSTQQERDIISKMLQQDRVLIRLRTAIPAGQQGS